MLEPYECNGLGACLDKSSDDDLVILAADRDYTYLNLPQTEALISWLQAAVRVRRADDSTPS